MQPNSQWKKESKMSTERRKVLQTEELLYEAVLLCVPSAGVFTFLPVAKMEKLDCGAVAFLWMTSPFGRAYPAHHRPDHGTMWFSKRLSDWVTDIPCCVAFRVFTTLTLPQSGLAREKPREEDVVLWMLPQTGRGSCDWMQSHTKWFYVDAVTVLTGFYNFSFFISFFLSLLKYRCLVGWPVLCLPSGGAWRTAEDCLMALNNLLILWLSDWHRFHVSDILNKRIAGAKPRGNIIFQCGVLLTGLIYLTSHNRDLLRPGNNTGGFLIIARSSWIELTLWRWERVSEKCRLTPGGGLVGESKNGLSDLMV